MVEDMPLSILDAILIVISSVFSVVDLVLDVKISYEHSMNSDHVFAILTMVFASISALATSVTSLGWYWEDEVNRGVIPPISRKKWIVRSIALIFQLDFLLRAYNIIRYMIQYRKCKGDVASEEQYSYHCKKQVGDYAFLGIIESFTESAPQLVLQARAIIKEGESENIFSSITLKETKLIISLIQLAWSIPSYYSKARAYMRNYHTPFLTKVIRWLWQLTFLAARLLVLILATCIFPWTVALAAIAVHWFVMWMWIIYLQFKVHTFLIQSLNNISASILAITYIFTFVNIKHGPTRNYYAVYYPLIFIENTIVAIYTFQSTDSKISELKLPIIAIIQEVLFFLSVVFMAIYYRCYHTNNIRPFAAGCCSNDTEPDNVQNL